jgi:nucleoside-diphosphate-sugar epimerase
MNILITGSEGFIGGHLKAAIPDADLVDLKLGNDIRCCDTDKKYDIIYHLAANASIPASLENPYESHDNNVNGFLKILELARRFNSKLVFSSSSSIYGDPEEIPTRESAASRPMSPYALQKLICEDYMRLYWQLYSVKGVALRYFNVYGEGQENANGGYSLALSRFLCQNKIGDPFTIIGTGEQRRDFVYVGDVVRANLEAAKWLEYAETFEVFNVGSGIDYSINEICDMINPNAKREYLPPRIEPMVGLADITKAEMLLGWKPLITLKEWLSYND